MVTSTIASVRGINFTSARPQEQAAFTQRMNVWEKQIERKESEKIKIKLIINWQKGDRITKVGKEKENHRNFRPSTLSLCPSLSLSLSRGTRCSLELYATQPVGIAGPS